MFPDCVSNSKLKQYYIHFKYSDRCTSVCEYGMIPETVSTSIYRPLMYYLKGGRDISDFPVINLHFNQIDENQREFPVDT